MLLPYPDLGRYRRPTPQQLGWLLTEGVRMSAVMKPPMLLLARGARAPDGCFEDDPAGVDWLVFPEAEDCIFWQPRSGELATWNGRAFALGEDLIGAAGTFAFGGYIRIFQDPLDWLRADRDGVVIADWSQAFDRLRDVPRLAVAEALLDILKDHLQPPHLPEIFVIPRQQEDVA